MLAFSPFRLTSHAHKVMSKSTINIRDMKLGDKPIVLAIPVDVTRMSAQKKLVALIQGAISMELR